MDSRKRIVGIYYNNRSEHYLLLPILRRLRVKGITVYENPELGYEKIDLIIAPFDRPHVVENAVRAFYEGIPLCQIHAGDKSQGSLDDRGRWVITALSQIHFCNGEVNYHRVRAFLELIGKPATHVYQVGSTALDDVVIDTSECPTEPYGLIVYNPPTPFSHDEVTSDFRKLLSLIKDKKDQVVWIQPNGDEGSDLIINYAQTLKTDYKPTLPHAKYLGLISKAKWMAGNSSSMYLEATYWNTPTHQIGARNMGRDKIIPEPGASDKIVDILTKIGINELVRLR